MLQPNKFDQIIPHFKGQLTRGYPRKVVVQQTIDELREQKIPLFNAWSIRFEVPLDMAVDCDQAIGWIKNRLMDYKDAGFKLIELSAEIRETKRDRESKDPGTWEPYWSGMVVHPQSKDPRKTVKNCVHYGMKQT